MTLPTELKSKFIQILNQHKISHSVGWSNYMESVNNPVAIVVEVKNEKEVQTVMMAIKELNSDREPKDKVTVRATAGWTDKPGKSCCFFPWSEAQESQYNEGFSFSQVVGGKASPDKAGTDVIIRFAKKFHHAKVIGPLKNPPVFNPDNPIHRLPVTLVEVSAGMQVADFADFLREHQLSLSTVSMISWVTPVGLAGTAGHGTGRDEPAFSGLIESVTVCDMDGNLREINSTHPDFKDLIGGHSGLLGIVVSMKLRAVKAFNLCETIELFPNTREMTGRLSDILKNNQYISIMGMPSYGCPESDKLVSKWQIRQWNYTTDKPGKKEKAPYDPDVRSFAQELQVRIGASVMDFLLDSGLKHLLPSFMLLSAAVVTGTRGTSPKVDYENHITHPQVAFPKEMRDVSYLIPVKDNEAGQKLELILQKMEAMLNEAGSKGEFPVTYAIYVRYLKGTNGGLSTSFTSSDDERILAIDVVTHPEAPGITNFEKGFMSFLKEMNIIPRNHLGKNFPAGVVHYDQFLGAEKVSKYKQALERFYCSPGKNDGAERLSMSPFYTPYLQSMLSASAPTNQLVDENKYEQRIERLHEEHSDLECAEFLSKLYAEVSRMSTFSEEALTAKKGFLEACKAELEHRNSRLEAPVPLLS
ncbi:TPA: L-gulono-gamma-lactone oxidase [Legionella pneumophila subsp. pneumophila]|uniref:L-gulono-gamma-lactone oxidase n=1 Tax=Legionella pneumophila TaxID=446 RepID=UPI0001E3C23D|nr:L-gulono-gamma-lactone oxidase [Legionella pneumophila]MDC8029400.1 L-gulono-gamma-lactone oxidase [Legionella pneumophila subsp. pneumophila]MDW8868477.1 L-gulono-gamma-lactone oxidase [Legionella pneumophila]MDW8914487.1 L-gulono-gamma-lactone oxidase [Legionella pneumophila]MDW8924452.1 L-gulono-gamma-lactone oxidase [Legionella pneumophila]MDW8929970.1 L-gulono-gamma-lactone oxidase [Legionella pneumophila]